MNTEKYALHCQKGFLSEDGFVEDVNLALQSVTKEKMVDIYQKIKTYKAEDENFKDLIFFIKTVKTKFPSPHNVNVFPRLTWSDPKGL